MKRLILVVATLLLSTWGVIAQTNDASSPATKEDIERYFQVVHSHDMLKKMAASLLQGQHNLIHELYLKHKDELPPDYESKMTSLMDDMFSNMPWDDMMQAMVPTYEKHFTKGDIDSLVAFYSSPTGEKLLRELPAILAESMQNATPIMVKYMETIQERVKNETDTMIAQSKKSSGKPAAGPN